MHKAIRPWVSRGLEKQVPPIGLGVFRFFFGLVVLHEVGFLLYFRHLIFDPVPFLDPASPLIALVLVLWAVAALHLCVGRYTRRAAIANYIFWLMFLIFTPMWQDFDGGFDRLMTAGSFLLIFLPSERAFAIDSLRLNLKFSNLETGHLGKATVSILCYYLPVGICLGLPYFDSALHKLSAEFWRNGMGAWLPLTMPYYISALDMSWLLNIQLLQQTIGYSIIIFQFVFVFLFFRRKFRVPLLLMGMVFHVGIVVSLNIYPYGAGMLVFYFLMVPFSWWRWLKKKCCSPHPTLVALYNQDCPRCNRTVITLRHFDIFQTLEFKALQIHGREHSELGGISDERLLKDLCAIDGYGRLYLGLDAYIRIFLAMKYTLLLGSAMKCPGIYHFCIRGYRKIAGHRPRPPRGDTYIARPETSFPLPEREFSSETYVATTRQSAQRIAKFLVIVFFLQLNSSIHYGVIYRLGIERNASTIGRVLTGLSNNVLLFSHTFLGITPHGLYLHDHFEGFNHIFAFTYRQRNGEEKWLPFVNEQGRMIAPNWGRVQSMWANAAVMADVEFNRFFKFTKKVTAFWGTKLGLDLSDCEFSIKMKEIRTPMEWEKDLRNKNVSRPWLDIGKVIWKDGSMRVEIPDVELNKL